MMLRMFRNLVSAESIGLLLTALALKIYTYGVASSLPNTDTQYFFEVCLVAALIGLGSGQGRSKPIQASVGIVAVGLVGIWILGARLANPLLELLRSAVSLIPQIIPALQSKSNIDAHLVTEAWRVIVEASTALALRFQSWWLGLNQNVSVNDALVRNMIWLFMNWLAAAWLGWFTARRNAIAALLPSIIILAFVTSYSEYRVWTIWVLVFVMLLLMGIWNYKNHIRLWETRQVDYSESIRYDSTQAVIGLTFVVCSIAFVTPSVSWREVRDYLREHDKNSNSEAADILGIQEPTAIARTYPIQKPSLPREHLLTGGYAQSEKIVMTIRTGELPPIPDPTFTANVPRYYWRSVVYDKYMGSGWITSSAPSQTFSANTPLIPGLLSDHRLIHLDVHLEQPEGKLFWSGTLFSADVPLVVDWRFRPQSELFADQQTLLQADMFAARTNVTAYTAESYVPNVTIAELQAASGEYPQDIVDRYLALPSSVPARVIDLAKEITQEEATPYDKAKAIETYLRANYPYDLEVPAPPTDRDVADYFLFDLKKGYCDYYATTMVVMARAVGVPARFVSGYSPGSYDASNAEYVIRELNAHSWAEVYFTGIGWVEFEPTGSIPEIVRAKQGTTLTPTQGNDSTAARLLNRFRLEQAAYLLLPVLIVTTITLFYFMFIERWRYLRMLPSDAIEQIYRKFYRAGRPFAGPRTRAETSHEFAQKLIHKFNELNERSRFKKILASLKSNTSTLTVLYDSALFVDVQMQLSDARAAWNTWAELRWHLLFARIVLYLANQSAKTQRP